MNISNEAITKIRQSIQSRQITLADGSRIPTIGQGTWRMGEHAATREAEIQALRLGIKLGLRLIDTAEMYGDGQSEELVGEAIKEQRDDIFLVSKVLPSNAGRESLPAACEQSLRRLGTDHLDLYLLHWKGSVPIEETIEAMESLRASGKILRWGVSNFDTADMQKLWEQRHGSHCAANQVLYHLGSRGIETSLLPWQSDHHLPVIAYCPLAEGGTLKNTLLESNCVRTIAADHQASPMQILLAWVIRHAENDGMIAIPKAAQPEHVLDNARAAAIRLTNEEQLILDKAFPAPTRKVPLDIV
ncbi:MAG: aldo/keto reductase [Sporolactobacillus sp.]